MAELICPNCGEVLRFWDERHRCPTPPEGVSEKAVEAALNAIYGSKSDSFHHEVKQALEAALPAILSDLRQELLGDRAINAAVAELDAVYADLDAPDTTDDEDARSIIRAALDSLADHKGDD